MNSILNFQERQCCLKKKGGGSRTSKHMIYIDSTSTKYWLPSTSWRLCQRLHMITTVCIQCIWIKIHNSHRSLLLKFVFKSFIYLYIYFIYSYVCTTCKHIQSCYCFVFFRSVTDPRDGKRVALKKMPSVFQNLVSSKRVFRELRMLCHFKHDNVSLRSSI